MSLLQQINQDRKDARRDGNNVLAQTLTTLLGEASMPGFNDGKRDSTDAEVIKVATKFRNAAVENVALRGLDQHTRDGFANEILAYEKYLPKQLTESEMADIIRTHFMLAVIDKSLKGRIMGHFKTNHTGMYDGKVLAALVDATIAAN